MQSVVLFKGGGFFSTLNADFIVTLAGCDEQYIIIWSLTSSSSVVQHYLWRKDDILR